MNAQTLHQHIHNTRHAVPTPTKRGLSREESAGYIGVSTSKFDQMVLDGRMPPARRIDGRRIWDIRQLDSYFDRLPGCNTISDNPWD
ncbi:hypothetical protein SAMN04488040_2806 [Sulfitobacter marinus]|jgi:predicted DNA-binding transcriptional regulator AlpA|uniref:Transcriptional regulator, AlpA family n=1 Tax=Sulfitobacter marinus TaxID=394264 RepID=A0A1I6UKR4_9RHOB|nr:hypothetical protein [Sulfitobacter marinus]SFT02030.1 hypothetical protein SAMN04488040_2806 [Sulfitobacter marinus]